MTSGVRLFSSCTGGSSEHFIHGESGISFISNSSQSLSSAMKKYIDNPNPISTIVANGKAICLNEFVVSKSVSQIIALIESTASY